MQYPSRDRSGAVLLPMPLKAPRPNGRGSVKRIVFYADLPDVKLKEADHDFYGNEDDNNGF
jgi:hypothetical protein